MWFNSPLSVAITVHLDVSWRLKQKILISKLKALVDTPFAFFILLSYAWWMLVLRPSQFIWLNLFPKNGWLRFQIAAFCFPYEWRWFQLLVLPISPIPTKKPTPKIFPIQFCFITAVGENKVHFLHSKKPFSAPTPW